ncbi:branched-chain amino acid ABC transporter permease [Roseibium sp. SCP14]|uniref:branched-chain amino acid ABC transporter permease n=1 Tax=Roseibium sp. SCP14 TaxID=3141375 RepID=UPI00333A7583
MDIVLSILIHSVAFTALLYLISVGLSVTMGLMGFVNLAHGVFAMVGGYVTATLITAVHLPWWAAIALTPFIVSGIGVVVEKVLYSRLYGKAELDQVLFSIGLLFVASAVAQELYGPLLIQIPMPASLLEPIQVLGVSTSSYKLVLVAVGASVALAVLYALERTTLGAMIRAAVENRTMAEGLGLNTSLLFSGTFALGTGLAALGGAIGAELFPITPAYGFVYLVYFMIVVAIAGLGTVRGAFIASFLVALISTISAYFLPEYGTIVLFAGVFLLLLVRPQGLFGRVS